MADASSFGLAELAGQATTTAELRACKIGGCCGKDTPMLPADEVQARLGALPLWSLSPDGTTISRELVAKNWKSAM